MDYKPLKQIAKEVRTQLKEEFPGCKFSVRTEYASMCQELKVKLLKADFEVFQPKSYIREAFERQGDDPTWLLCDLERGYTQVNQYYVNRSPLYTDEAKRVLKRVIEIANADNWDNSDVQIDYFDVNYYFFLTVGDWNRPVEIWGAS